MKTYTLTEGQLHQFGLDYHAYGAEAAFSVLPESPDRWIPVTERLPDNNHPVLCYMGREYVAHWYARDRCWYDTVGLLRNPSHWQPLPKAPVEDQSDGR